MKVYIAAPYAIRTQADNYASELERLGFAVTSHWIREEHEITPGILGPAVSVDDKEINAVALQNLADIDDADLVVMLTSVACGLVRHGTPAETGTTGGRHIETGYAMAKGKHVVVVGEAENVFHRIPSMCTVVPTWHEAVLELGHRLVERERIEGQIRREHAGVGR